MCRRRICREWGEDSGARGRHYQASELSHLAAFFCHASAGKRVGHKNGAGVVRAQGREHDDDLYPCVESTWDRGAQSDGCELRKGR